MPYVFIRSAGFLLCYCRPLRHLLRRWVSRDLETRHAGIVWNLLDHTLDGLDYEAAATPPPRRQRAN